MIAQELEVSLHMAFVEARQQRHEFITVEHLLLALLDNPSAAEVLRACSANVDDLLKSLTNFIKDNTTQVAGYPSVFAHGMLTMGLTGKMLTNYVGDGTLTKFGVRFTNQVWPGDTLDARATVAAIREEGGVRLVDLTLSTVNQDGKEVMTGNATAKIDA